MSKFVYEINAFFVGFVVALTFHRVLAYIPILTSSRQWNNVFHHSSLYAHVLRFMRVHSLPSTLNSRYSMLHVLCALTYIIMILTTIFLLLFCPNN